MPLGLIIIGLILVISAARGTTHDLSQLLIGDFTGSGNFFYWIIAIGIVGLVGYYAPMRGVSRMFLALILIVFVISNRGIFAQLVNAAQGATNVAGNTNVDIPSNQQASTTAGNPSTNVAASSNSTSAASTAATGAVADLGSEWLASLIG